MKAVPQRSAGILITMGAMAALLGIITVLVPMGTSTVMMPRRAAMAPMVMRMPALRWGTAFMEDSDRRGGRAPMGTRVA
mgnify:CR=1 FL=1